MCKDDEVYVAGVGELGCTFCGERYIRVAVAPGEHPRLVCSKCHQFPIEAVVVDHTAKGFRFDLCKTKGVYAKEWGKTPAMATYWISHGLVKTARNSGGVECIYDDINIAARE